MIDIDDCICVIDMGRSQFFKRWMFVMCVIDINDCIWVTDMGRSQFFNDGCLLCAIDIDDCICVLKCRIFVGRNKI